MRLFSIAAVACMLVMCGVNAADKEADKPKADASDNDESQLGMRAEASGKITGVREVDMVTAGEKHTLIKLLGDDGETDIVDLGSAEELKAGGIDPKEGGSLFVHGRIGKLNDRMVLVAESVSNTKMLKLARHSTLREETQKHAEKRGAAGEAAQTADSTANDRNIAPKKVSVDAGMQSRTVDGIVKGTRKVKVESDTEEHMLVKVQTETGIAIVDLGPASKLPQVDLTEGKKIAASGMVGKMNDRPMIFADSIGNLNDITWPAASAPEKK